MADSILDLLYKIERSYKEIGWGLRTCLVWPIILHEILPHDGGATRVLRYVEDKILHLLLYNN